jgi:hypothetical protein
MALQATCADVRNRLFVIDQVLTLTDRVGHCSDASFGQVLYGSTVHDVLCVNPDSIAGPVNRCMAPGYAEMFETMIGHLAEADLGLGTAHTVQQLKF